MDAITETGPSATDTVVTALAEMGHESQGNGQNSKRNIKKLLISKTLP